MTPLQKEDSPPSLRPFFIVKLQRGATFDEKRNDNLYAPDEFFDRRICQFPSPYLEVATSARVAVNKLPRRFEVLRRAVILNVIIEVGGAIESSWTFNMRFLETNIVSEKIVAYMRVSNLSISSEYLRPGYPRQI